MASPPTREPSLLRGQREIARAQVHAWFAAHGPDYPWRRTEDDPYAVLVSEVMLQQTQASRVAEAFPRFMETFPTVEILADAPGGDVIRAWAGMGYHRRAVALHAAARTIVREHAGVVPREEASLRELPGVGPYTASAVASIAFGVPLATIDTNVRKVMARVDHGAERDEVSEAQLSSSASAWLDRERPGDWNQALMTLGRSVCRTTPRCAQCPLASACRFRAMGRVGRPSVRAHPTFEGSMRQVRGAVVEVLREHPSLTLGRLSRLCGYPLDRVAQATAGLARDGVLRASEGALGGRAGGRVSLEDSSASNWLGAIDAD